MSVSSYLLPQQIVPRYMIISVITMVAVLETGKIIWFEGCLILEQFNLAQIWRMLRSNIFNSVIILAVMVQGAPDWESCVSDWLRCEELLTCVATCNNVSPCIDNEKLPEQLECLPIGKQTFWLSFCQHFGLYLMDSMIWFFLYLFSFY